MTPDNAKSESLTAVTVILVVSDAASLDYLQNILQFIDCDVHVPDSAEELQRLVERFGDRGEPRLLPPAQVGARMDHEPRDSVESAALELVPERGARLGEDRRVGRRKPAAAKRRLAATPRLRPGASRIIN